ncbi:hypothetical protein DOY81_011801 [Sarcophaga bullata]|nr:hypothetical protein DOY81_011801 [Sarcophaga bullata]
MNYVNTLKNNWILGQSFGMTVLSKEVNCCGRMKSMTEICHSLSHRMVLLVNYSWNDRSLEITRTLCEQERDLSKMSTLALMFLVVGKLPNFKVNKHWHHCQVSFLYRHFCVPVGYMKHCNNMAFNIKDPLGNDQTNEAFLLRNEKFWWLLWEHLATHPYNTMPFYTDFCMGSGKKTYFHGLPKASTKISDATKVEEEGDKENSSEGFFNLSRQSLQPSVPLHNLATRCYDDAFNGGSCLRINQYDHSFRLFATELKITRGGLVVGYALKLDPRNGEFDCILRICTNNNARDCYIFLGDYYDSI